MKVGYVVSIRQELLELFKQHRRITSNTLYELLPTIPQHTIRGRLSELVKEGYLKHIDNSTYEITDEAIIKELQKENEFLKQQLITSTKPHNIQTKYSSQIKIGILSDTHLGSIYDNIQFLQEAYATFNQQNITTVLHAGDFFDGERVFKGQEYLIHTQGIDNIIRFAENNYPKYNNITTFVIGGNHDYSFYKTTGCDLLNLLSKTRHDIVCLGYITRTIQMPIKNNILNIMLYHINGAPSTNTAKKIFNNLKLSERPHILVIGHTHKTLLTKDRDLFILHPGCIQLHTPFMKGIPTEAAVGFWILEIIMKNNSINTLNASWIECS